MRTHRFLTLRPKRLWGSCWVAAFLGAGFCIPLKKLEFSLGEGGSRMPHLGVAVFLHQPL